MGILRPLTYDASLQLGFLFGEEIGLLTDLQREVYHIRLNVFFAIQQRKMPSIFSLVVQ
jgi:hypothetical protein